MANIKNKVSVDDDNFQAILMCAVRYSLGRQTYMPHLVMDYIAPLVPLLSDRTLAVIERDIGEADKMGVGYGNERIDKPRWLQFRQLILSEIKKRKNT